MQPKNNQSKHKYVLVSACLMGFDTRYDGNNSKCNRLPLEDDEIPIPFCPEQLGGLPTPREPVEIRNGSGEDVLDGEGIVAGIDTGIDVTNNFIRGARETIKTAKYYNCFRAVLKSKSPSCGYGSIYHDGELIQGNGVTAAALIRDDVSIQSI